MTALNISIRTNTCIHIFKTDIPNNLERNKKSTKL
uniref:Uncharacterized protein n=1 Tax=Arundo donax TaxID=35708 RepID=A0A0A9AM33_ARUDO